MRRLGCGLGLAALLAASIAAPAFAAPSGLFGNTLAITTPEGLKLKYNLKGDGTYAGLLNDGIALAGTWVENNGQLCLTQTAPFAAPANCAPTITQGPGVGWATARPDGRSNQFTIVRGRN